MWYERKVDAKCLMDWIDLNENRDRWRSLVNAAMKLWVLQNAGNFLTCWGPVSLPGRALPHGVSRRVEFWRNFGNGVTAWELCSATWNFGTNSVFGGGVAQLAEALRYKPEGRGFHSWWCHRNFSLTCSFRPHCGSGVDSTSNRSECQGYLLWGKGGRCVGLTTLPPSCADCPEIWEPHSGSVNRPVQVCFFTYFSLGPRTNTWSIQVRLNSSMGANDAAVGRGTATQDGRLQVRFLVGS